MSTPRPPTPPSADPLLQAYEDAERLLGADAPQPADAVRDRVLAAALATRAEAPAVAPVPQRAAGAANAPRWRWAAVAASVCTVSLATLVALRVQMDSPHEEFVREAPVAKPAPAAGAEAPAASPAEAAAAAAPPPAATTDSQAPSAAAETRPSEQKAAAQARHAAEARKESRQREAAKSAETAERAAQAAATMAAAEPAAAPRETAPQADAVAQAPAVQTAPPARREAAAPPAPAAAPVAPPAAPPAARAAAPTREAETDHRIATDRSAGFSSAAPVAKAMQPSAAQRNATAAAAGRVSPQSGAQTSANASLHRAAEAGDLDAVKQALAAGADVKSLNRYGGTALIPACHYGHVAIVRELLLTTAIDRNHVNNLGWTALLEAVLLGDGGPRHTEIVKLLLAHGADPNIADRAGITPLQHARQRGYTAMAQAIEAAGGR